MTDEARIARLTELARRVFPGSELHRSQTTAEVGVLDEIELQWRSCIKIVEHPKALEALDAALLVLADEERVPLTERQVLEDRIKAAERDRESILRRYKELAGEPPAVARIPASGESGKTVQLRLDGEAVSALSTLQDATGRASKAEVLRDALGVYQSLHRMLDGQKVVLALVDRQAGQLQELSFPTLAPVDALEAALLVLAGETPRQHAESFFASLPEPPNGLLAVADVSEDKAQPPAWVEQLASEWLAEAESWERAARGMDRWPESRDPVQMLKSCARELRARASKPCE